MWVVFHIQHNYFITDLTELFRLQPFPYQTFFLFLISILSILNNSFIRSLPFSFPPSSSCLFLSFLMPEPLVCQSLPSAVPSSLIWLPGPTRQPSEKRTRGSRDGPDKHTRKNPQYHIISPTSLLSPLGPLSRHTATTRHPYQQQNPTHPQVIV